MSLRQKFILLLEYSRIHKQFQQFFRVIPALSPELQQQAYRIRHQVYCRELGWEDVRTDGMETEPFDAQSQHCLMQNINNDEYIGCIRMVLQNPDDLKAPLPFQQACKEVLDSGEPDPEHQRKCAIAEVSRLAIIGKYRRRPHELEKSFTLQESDYGTLQQPRFPYIPIGLYMGLLEMAKINQVETLYILTEPSLAKHFCKLGGKLYPIGEAIEHRGKRVPYKMDVAEVIKQINLLLKPLYKVISAEIRQGYQQHRLNTSQQTVNRDAQ